MGVRLICFHASKRIRQSSPVAHSRPWHMVCGSTAIGLTFLSSSSAALMTAALTTVDKASIVRPQTWGSDEATLASYNMCTSVNKCCGNKFLIGSNFRKWALDCKNRENFCFVKVSHYMVSKVTNSKARQPATIPVYITCTLLHVLLLPSTPCIAIPFSTCILPLPLPLGSASLLRPRPRPLEGPQFNWMLWESEEREKRREEERRGEERRGEERRGEERRGEERRGEERRGEGRGGERRGEERRGEERRGEERRGEERRGGNSYLKQAIYVQNITLTLQYTILLIVECVSERQLIMTWIHLHISTLYMHMRGNIWSHKFVLHYISPA